MSDIQITPTLQCQREIDCMLRNVTRDVDKVREFVAKEKNDLYRAELTKILSATLQFADRYDGCSKATMNTIEFKKEAKSVFQKIAGQRRGGRKILFVMLSSPTSGLDQQFAGWWPTVRGLDGVAVRMMESYLKSLTMDITAEADTDDLTVPAPILSKEDSQILWKKRLLSDVTKTVKFQLDQVTNCEGYSIGTASDEDGTVFTMTVTFINTKGDDSGVQVVDAAPPVTPKKELPTPMVAHVVPKSEASRDVKNDKICDQDGFWIETDDDENDFIQIAKLTPKGCINRTYYNYYFKDENTFLKNVFIFSYSCSQFSKE